MGQDWWRSFGDPTLEKLIHEALAHNTDVRSAAARVGESKALAAVQHAGQWPTLELAAYESHSRSLSAVTGRPYEAVASQLQFQAAYEVDLWGRIRALSRAADASYLGSTYARAAASLSVAASTASAYFSLRAIDARLQIAQETLRSRAVAATLARSRESSGYTSKLELAQAEAEFRATAQVVPQLQLARTRQEHALGVLLGRPAAAVERGRSLDDMAIPPLPVLGMPSELLRRRPDVAASEAQIIAGDAQLAAARAQLLPALRLSGSAGRSALSIVQGPFTLWNLGGSILAPIFEGGRLRAQAQVSASRLDLAVLDYEKSVLVAITEVEDQLAAIEQIERQRLEVDGQREALAQAQRIASDRRREGYASYLEELDAQRALFGAEQAAVQLRGDLLVAYVGLFRALGGGWHAQHSAIDADWPDALRLRGSRRDSVHASDAR